MDFDQVLKKLLETDLSIYYRSAKRSFKYRPPTAENHRANIDNEIKKAILSLDEFDDNLFQEKAKDDQLINNDQLNPDYSMWTRDLNQMKQFIHGKHWISQGDIYSKLIVLNIQAKNIQNLDPSLCFCRNLKYLNVSRNKLTLLRHLPAALIVLHAHGNNLADTAIRDLQACSIKVLGLSYNSFQNLEAILDWSPKAEVIDLSYNCLSHTEPAVIGKLALLKSCLIKGNPMCLQPTISQIFPQFNLANGIDDKQILHNQQQASEFHKNDEAPMLEFILSTISVKLNSSSTWVNSFESVLTLKSSNFPGFSTMKMPASMFDVKRDTELTLSCSPNFELNMRPIFEAKLFQSLIANGLLFKMSISRENEIIAKGKVYLNLSNWLIMNPFQEAVIKSSTRLEMAPSVLKESNENPLVEIACTIKFCKERQNDNFSTENSDLTRNKNADPSKPKSKKVK